MRNNYFLQIIVLILLAAGIGIGISVWQPWKTSNRTIEVNGEGKIKSAPDVAQISGGVEVKKPTANDAQTVATDTLNKILAAVKEKGIEDKDIKTENITTGPNYEYSSSSMQTNGYISRASITITIRDISKGQEIVDLVTKNGGTNVYGPNLTFSDEKLEELKNQARDIAVGKAKAKADQLAKSTNARVGKIISISESSSSGGTVIPYLASDVAVSSTKESSSTILPGESEVTVLVSATYALK